MLRYIISFPQIGLHSIPEAIDIQNIHRILENCWGFSLEETEEFQRQESIVRETISLPLPHTISMFSSLSTNQEFRPHETIHELDSNLRLYKHLTNFYEKSIIKSIAQSAALLSIIKLRDRTITTIQTHEQQKGQQLLTLNRRIQQLDQDNVNLTRERDDATRERDDATRERDDVTQQNTDLTQQNIQLRNVAAFRQTRMTTLSGSLARANITVETERLKFQKIRNIVIATTTFLLFTTLLSQMLPDDSISPSNRNKAMVIANAIALFSALFFGRKEIANVKF